MRAKLLELNLMKYIFLFIVFLTSTTHAIELPKEARLKNPGAYCTWTCLDTLARTHNIKNLRGILRQRWDKNHGFWADFGYDYLIEQELIVRKIDYKIFPQFSYNNTLLTKYANNLGVSVCLKQGNPFSGGCHQIVVTSFDDSYVKFYDPDNPDRDFTCGRGWFDMWWLGNSIVIFPNKDI